MYKVGCFFVPIRVYFIQIYIVTHVAIYTTDIKWCIHVAKNSHVWQRFPHLHIQWWACSCRPVRMPLSLKWACKCWNWTLEQEEGRLVWWIPLSVASCGKSGTCCTSRGCIESTSPIHVCIALYAAALHALYHDKSLLWLSPDLSAISATVVLLLVCTTWNSIFSYLTYT